jgi:sulfate permease, SulP family
LILRAGNIELAEPHNFANEFTPKLLSQLREGYGFSDFRKDLTAGLTVAIVALPLSMAIAIASHASPERGLYTSIIGGFIISALGGSRFQIGGPAGAFIVVVAAIIDRHGYDGLLLATMMAGFVLLIAALLRLGTYIKYVPHPVTIGFTAGIGVIIFASQIKELIGLKLNGLEPAPFVAKLNALWQVLPTFNPQAITVSALTIAIIAAVRKLKPLWPTFLIAITATSVLTHVLGSNVETIASKFGGIPHWLLPATVPSFSGQKLIELFPDALTLAFLCSISSLLSAAVADSMTGRHHHSNGELLAQGVANIIGGFFGAMTATGAVARTITNVKYGSTGPVSGLLHACFLLLFMAIAAPLAGYIPLPSLASIIAVVAWNMLNLTEVKRLVTFSKSDAIIVISTILLVVFVGLTTGIIAGVVLGSLAFMHRMAESIEIETHHHNAPLMSDEFKAEHGVIIHRISGAFFFGAASAIAAILERYDDKPKAYILDFADVPFVDSSAANTLKGFLTKAKLQNATVYLTGASVHVRRELISSGIKKPRVRYGHSIENCLSAIHNGHEIDEHQE